MRELADIAAGIYDEIIGILLIILAAVLNAARDYRRHRRERVPIAFYEMLIVMVSAFLIGIAASSAVSAWTDSGEWARAAGIVAALLGLEYLERIAGGLIEALSRWRQP